MPRIQHTNKETLINHGMKLMRDKGFTATGLNEILNAATAPKGSFYHHFENKEAFGLAVLERYFLDHMTFFTKMTKGDEAAKDRLRAYFLQMINALEANNYSLGCFIGDMTLEVGNQSAQFQARLAVMFAGWGQAIAVLIREGQKEGEISRTRAAEDLAEFILSSWEGALITARAKKDRRPLDVFIAIIFESVLS